MGNTEKDDSHAQEISENISGGGCAEAWEAAQELREEDQSTRSRRNVMLGVGASLLFGVSATGATQAKKADAPDQLETTVQSLDGGEKKEAINIALANDDVENIREELQSRGLSADLKSATAHKSVYDENEHLTIKIPFETREESDNKIERSAGLIWSSWSSGLTHGFISKREIKKDATISADVREIYNKSNVDISSMDSLPVEIKYTTISQKSEQETDESSVSIASNTSGGEIEVNTNSQTVPLKDRSERRLSTQGVGDCICTAVLGTNPVTACAPCGTHKPDCLAQIVSTFGAEIGACAGCAVASAWTGGAGAVAACTPCLGAIAESVGSGEINDVCCWCDFGGSLW